MPYKDSEKQKEADRKYRQRVRQPDKPVEPVVSNPEAEWKPVYEKVRQHAAGADVEFTPSELKTILQWGIDTGRIQPRCRVAEYYGLTQKYGPARLDKHELLNLLNGDIQRKKVDSRLYYLGASSGTLADAFLYSNEW